MELYVRPSSSDFQQHFSIDGVGTSGSYNVECLLAQANQYVQKDLYDEAEIVYKRIIENTEELDNKGESLLAYLALDMLLDQAIEYMLNGKFEAALTIHRLLNMAAITLKEYCKSEIDYLFNESNGFESNNDVSFIGVLESACARSCFVRKATCHYIGYDYLYNRENALDRDYQDCRDIAVAYLKHSSDAGYQPARELLNSLTPQSYIESLELPIRNSSNLDVIQKSVVTIKSNKTNNNKNNNSNDVLTNNKVNINLPSNQEMHNASMITKKSPISTKPSKPSVAHIELKLINDDYISTIDFDLPTTWKASHLKLAILDMTGIPVSKQTIIYYGKIVEDKQACDFKVDSTLYISLKKLTDAEKNGAIIKSLARKAHDGIVQAQFELGVHYMEGKIVKQSNTQTLNYLIMAHVNGHKEAAYMLGCSYKTRTLWTQEKEPVEQKKWFKIAADEGHADAAFELMRLYGADKEKGIANFLEYATLAHKLGNKEAATYVVNWYGRIFPNPTEEIKQTVYSWYLEALKINSDQNFNPQRWLNVYVAAKAENKNKESIDIVPSSKAQFEVRDKDISVKTEPVDIVKPTGGQVAVKGRKPKNSNQSAINLITGTFELKKFSPHEEL